jgi:hypothetical protein
MSEAQLTPTNDEKTAAIKAKITGMIEALNAEAEAAELEREDAEIDARYCPPAGLAVSAKVSEAVSEIVTYSSGENETRAYFGGKEEDAACFFALMEGAAAVAHARGFTREEAVSLLIAAHVKDSTLYDWPDGLSEEQLVETIEEAQRSVPGLFRHLDALEGKAWKYRRPSVALSALDNAVGAGVIDPGEEYAVKFDRILDAALEPYTPPPAPDSIKRGRRF